MTRRRWERLSRIGFCLVLVLGILLRLRSASVLWLDEAISVNISKLPLDQLFAALKQDGSPPAYYLILHYWIAVFGQGDTAVRSLSVVFSIAALGVMFQVGRRLGGRSTAVGATVLLAVCPYAIRYATETRMYSMLVLLSLLGLWALLRAEERPSLGRLVPVAVVSGILALTHYWALFLLLAVGLVQLYRLRRGPDRSRPLRELIAMCCGGVLFLPWIPDFLFQLKHTGTPWAPSPQVTEFFGTVQGWWGAGSGSLVLYVLAIVLLLLGVLGRGWTSDADRGHGTVTLRLPERGWPLVLAATGLGTLVVGLVISRVGSSGYAIRYSAPALAATLLLMACGAAALPTPARRVVLTAFAVFGLLVSMDMPFQTNRTQARQTAAVISAGIRPGDLVVYCPDQLGPAVDRLLPAGTREVVYPTLGSPERVDWVDYAQRNEAAQPEVIATQINSMTTGAIWLVRADGYRTFGSQCAELDDYLSLMRGTRITEQGADGRDGESQMVVRFSATG